MIVVFRKILLALLLSAIAVGCGRQQKAPEAKAAIDIPTIEFEDVTEYDFGKKFRGCLITNVNNK